MKKRLIIYVAVIVVAALWTPAVSGETVSPGKLYSHIRSADDGTRRELMIEGSVRAEELSEFRTLSETVERLDLSNLVILGSQSTADTDGASIPAYAFFGSKVKRLVLPTTLKKLGEGAFAESSIEEIQIPETLEEVGAHAFYRCVALHSIDLTGCRVETIPTHCFYGCMSLKDVGLSSGTGSIGDKAFMKSSVEVIDLSGVSEIGAFSFSLMPALKEITLNNNVEIGEGAFYGNPQLTGLPEIEGNSPQLLLAGSGAEMDELRISSEVIEPGSYSGVSAKAIRLGASVREIRENAFRNATSIGSVDVVRCGSNPPILDAEGFAGVDVSHITLRVKEGEEDVWSAAAGWRDFMIVSSSAVEETNFVSGIKIERSGNRFLITTPSIIEDVEVYNPSGMLLYKGTPRSESCETPEFTGEKIVLLRVKTPVATKVATLSTD